MKKISLLIYFIFFVNFLFAQDSTQWNLYLGMEASVLHLNKFTNSKEINIEEDIGRQRRWFSPLHPSRRTVSDNPNFHAAIYSGFKIKTSFRKKYHLQTDLFFEHRGASYGANDTDNITFFPQFNFSFRDTFHILKRQFELDFEIGNKAKHQIGNGLKFYNIDDQSGRYKISHKNFFYQYHQIADLSYGIGLNAEEYFQFDLGYENTDFQFSIYYALNKTLNRNNLEDYPEWGASGNYFFNKNYEVFFQVGTRHFQKYDIKNNSAFVLGANCKLIHNNKITWNLFPKIRYYSAIYNSGHSDVNVIYRKLNGQIYSNTVGRYLYPLRNYFYNFDQWAVFTEYQNENILGLGLKTDFQIKIHPKFFIKTEIETLSLRRSESFYTNYFYTFEIFYSPANGLNFGALLTNKTYNLDVHFPTFYMMKSPMIGLSLKLDLKERKIL